MNRKLGLVATLLLLPFVVHAAPEPDPRYKNANAALGKPKPGEQRVVFFGSSSVDGWKLDREFPGRPFVNRGISGQNTRQMLARFDQDVIALVPSSVVLHIGAANDLGAIPQKETIENLRTMIRRARAAGATPILYSCTPTRGQHLRARPVAKVQALRDEMRKLAADEKVAFVDVYSLVADARGELREDLTRDGMHLTAKGYELIRKPTLEAVDRALSGKGLKDRLPTVK